MQYRRFIASSNVDFKINDHLIECGQTTWQIRNIAATSIGKRVIPFREPEPIFQAEKPKLDINISKMAIFSALAWIATYILTSSSNLGIIAALGVAGATIYFAKKNLDQRNFEWEEQKAAIEREWKIWDEMRRNPPVLHSLTLETNAGSKPLFYSLDRPQIVKVNETIKRSMEKKETGDIKFEIETVNVGGEDSINNFGSSIYQQSIQESQNDLRI